MPHWYLITFPSGAMVGPTPFELNHVNIWLEWMAFTFYDSNDLYVDPTMKFRKVLNGSYVIASTEDSNSPILDSFFREDIFLLIMPEHFLALALLYNTLLLISLRQYALSYNHYLTIRKNDTTTIFSVPLNSKCQSNTCELWDHSRTWINQVPNIWS